MSKERARRRAERLAAQEKAQAVRARREARRAAVRRIRLPRLSRSGTLHRRSRGERAGIVVVPLAAVALIWLLVPDLALRILLTVVIVLTLPVLVVLVLGRRA